MSTRTSVLSVLALTALMATGALAVNAVDAPAPAEKPVAEAPAKAPVSLAKALKQYNAAKTPAAKAKIMAAFAKANPGQVQAFVNKLKAQKGPAAAKAALNTAIKALSSDPANTALVAQLKTDNAKLLGVKAQTPAAPAPVEQPTEETPGTEEQPVPDVTPQGGNDQSAGQDFGTTQPRGAEAQPQGNQSSGQLNDTKEETVNSPSKK